MKRVYSLFVGFVVIILLTRCTRGNQDPNPLQDGKPRIITIQFPGIPDNNISIDQHNFIITIKLPPALPADIIPNLELTDNAKLVPKSWYTLFVGQCPECKLISLVNRSDESNTPVVHYQVQLIPTAPLTLQTFRAPLEHVLGVSGELFVPLENVYANPLPQRVTFTHRITHEVVYVDTASTKLTPVLLRGWGPSINQIGIAMNHIDHWLPGEYDVEMTLRSGQKIRLPEPLTVKAGPLIVSQDWEPNEGPQIQPGTFVTIKGTNLFTGDLSVSLLDSLDQVLPLSTVQSDKYGHRLEVIIPATVKHGHYVLHLERAGAQPMTSCHRLHIRSALLTPFEIITLGDTLVSCSLKGPVPLRRNRWIGITVNGLDAKARFKLTSVQDKSKIYFVKAYLYSYTNDQGAPVTYISDEVPAGLYTATLQTLTATDEVLEESLPFWRTILLW